MRRRTLSCHVVADGRRELVTFEEKITCGKSYKKIKASSIR